MLSTRGQITQNSISLEVEQALCGILDDEDAEDEDEDGDEDGDRLGVSDGETIQDLEVCIEQVGLSARRSDKDGKPNLDSKNRGSCEESRRTHRHTHSGHSTVQG